MSSGGRKKPSISVPSIFVALAGKGKDKEVKILFPKSIEALKKSVSGIFRLKKEITCFFGDDGYKIEDVNDIIPGSIVYVSTSITDLEKKPKQAEVVKESSESISYDDETELEELLKHEKEEESISYDDDYDDSKQNVPVLDLLTIKPKEQQDAKESANEEKIQEEKTETNEEKPQKIEKEKPKKGKSQIPVPKRIKKPEHYLQENDEVVDEDDLKAQAVMSDEPALLSSEQIDTAEVDRLVQEEEKVKEATTDDIESIKLNSSSQASALSEISNSYITNSEEETQQEDNKSNDAKENEEKTKQSEDNEEEEDEEEEKDEKLLGVIEEMVGKENKEAAENAYNCLPGKVKEFYDTALTVEEQQNFRYINKINDILKREHFIDSTEIKYKKEIEEKANEFLKNHSSSSPCGTTYNFQAAILGPKSSGKSTFLGILANQLALELTATGMNKKYFLFLMDMNSVSFTLSNIVSFYKWFVAHTFSLVFAQAPMESKWADTLISSFNSIVDSSSPMLSKRFLNSCENKTVTSNIQAAFDAINECWRSKEYFEQWISNVINLPKVVSVAFGYTDIIYIIDHFDLADTSLDGRSHFDEHSVTSLPLIFAGLIDQSPYILGTADISKAVSLFNYDIDVKLETISSFDIIPVKENEYDIHAYFEEESLGKLVFSITSAGGVPLYVSRWNELMELFNQLDEINCEDGDEDSQEHDDLMAELVTQVETYICLTFKLESFSVSNVVRKAHK